MSFFCRGRKLIMMTMNCNSKKYLNSSLRGLLVTKNQLTMEKLYHTPSDTDRLIESHKKEMPETVNILLAPYTYTRSLSSASAIPMMFEAYNYWMKIPEDKFGSIKDVLYLSYDAITMLDDVVDESDLRRNYPTSLRVYGPERTWLATYSIVLIAIEKLLSLNQTKAVLAICSCFISIHAALAKEYQVSNYSGYPSKDEYFKIVLGKTAAMHSLFLGVMQESSDCNKDFSRLIALIGLYSQANNDNMNLSKENIVNGKINAEDITSGVFTLPIILAADKKNLEADTVFHIVKQKSKDSYMKDYCVDLIYKLGAMENSKEIEQALYEELLNEIEKLGGNPILVDLFDRLHSVAFDKTHFPDITTKTQM